MATIALTRAVARSPSFGVERIWPFPKGPFLIPRFSRVIRFRDIFGRIYDSQPSDARGPGTAATLLNLQARS